MESITLTSKLNGKQKRVSPGDTVFCGMHGRNVRIVEIVGSYAIVSETSNPKPLAHYSHIAHLSAY